jgi:hypothetical protein
MKRILILFALVTLPVFADFDPHDWRGAYSFHFDGVAINSTSRAFVANLAAIGRFDADSAGNFSNGTRSLTFGTAILEQTFTGTYTVNPDGTGHAKLTFQPNNIHQEFDTVLTDGGREFNFNATVSGIAGVNAVVQGEGKRQ